MRPFVATASLLAVLLIGGCGTRTPQQGDAASTPAANEPTAAHQTVEQADRALGTDLSTAAVRPSDWIGWWS